MNEEFFREVDFHGSFQLWAHKQKLSFMGHFVIRAIFYYCFAVGGKPKMQSCLCRTGIALVARALGQVLNARIKGRPVFVREGIARRNTFVH